MQTEIKGEKRRRITMFTETGIKFGDGLVSDASKYKALCKCEKDQYEQEIKF